MLSSSFSEEDSEVQGGELTCLTQPISHGLISNPTVRRGSWGLPGSGSPGAFLCVAMGGGVDALYVSGLLSAFTLSFRNADSWAPPQRSPSDCCTHGNSGCSGRLTSQVHPDHLQLKWRWGIWGVGQGLGLDTCLPGGTGPPQQLLLPLSCAQECPDVTGGPGRVGARAKVWDHRPLCRLFAPHHQAVPLALLCSC